MTAPIDLLLISGTRHRPLRYLTDEQTRAEVEQAMATPDHEAPLDFIARAVERDTGDEPHFLQDWPILPPRGWTSVTG